MKKQYTKKQITEAIKHWENVLNKIGSNYQDFYCKKPWKNPARAMNSNALKYIDESILKSCIKLNDIWMYNTNSYMNLQRIYESSYIYLDEAKRETKDTTKFIDAIKNYCRSHIGFENGQAINFDEAFNVECYDPNENNTIFGNVMLDNFPFDTTKYSIGHHINQLSRKAILLGYNFVAYDVTNEINEDNYKTTFASIQFEASYFSGNVKFGSFLYHISPRSLMNKILSKGLLPTNKNNQGFNYSSRVYCFIDKYDEIMK